MSTTIDNNTLLKLANCFNKSPDSEWRYYVKVSNHNPHQSLVVRRRDDNRALYINSLKEGDEILTRSKNQVTWVKFGPYFDGLYVFTNLAKYIAELCNQTKNCHSFEKDFISLPCNEYIRYLLVKDNDLIFYLNIHGRFEPFLDLSDKKERIYSSTSFMMPVPIALIDFLIQELKMRKL